MVEQEPKEAVRSFLTKTIQKALHSISKDNKKPTPRINHPTSISMSSNQGLFLIREELTNVQTLDLIFRASNILEKIFWAVVAISGTIFIYHVVVLQLGNWQDNPTLVTTINRRLSDMPLPAVTFCHKGLNKYGPVERLLNFIDPEKNVPKDILAIQNQFLKVKFQEIKKRLYGGNFCQWLFNLPFEEKHNNIILSQIPEKDWWMISWKCSVSF